MMPERFRVLAAGIRAEFPTLREAVAHAVEATRRSRSDAENAEFLVEAAAFSVHSAYTAVERIFLDIARVVDQSAPSGADWHRDLVRQMNLEPSDLRPAVLSDEAVAQLQPIVRFRHLVRNVYSSSLDPERVAENVARLADVETILLRDLLAFADWLEGVSAT
jgi:hypothetical protein